MNSPNHAFSCPAVQARLDDYVDDALEASERRAVARHLEGCAACAGLASDLGRLRDAARGLGPIQPPAEMWGRIAAGMDGPRGQGSKGPRVRFKGPAWIGVAAAVAVAAAATLTIGRRPPAAIETPGNASAGDTVQSIEQNLLEADRLYREAIAQLETIVGTGAAGLDPAVAASLRRSQTTLDEAIAESRAALEQDPTNAAARLSLFEALGRKVRLLQDTIALVGTMRPGAEAPERKSS